MFLAACIGDIVSHDMLVPSGAIVQPINPNVMINFLPAAHVGCGVACTGATSAGPVHPPPPAPVPIIKGSSSVMINFTPAARLTPAMDTAGCGTFLHLMTGPRTVLIGG